MAENKPLNVNLYMITRNIAQQYVLCLDFITAPQNHLVGLVVKASAPGAEDPGFESRLRRDFSGSSHTSNLKNWHSSGAGTGRPGVSIL